MKTTIEIRTEILKKQCEVVGADFDKLDFISPESRWFMEYSWTKEQEEEFKKWLIDYMKALSKQDYYQLSNYTKNKTNMKKIAEEWCFNYGWKYSN